MSDYRFYANPATVRLALAYAERFTAAAAVAKFGVGPNAITKWRRERELRGPDWPTLEDDQRWLARRSAVLSKRRARKAAAMRRYRARLSANGGQLRVDPTTTQRRIRALVALGHTTDTIAEHGGWSRGGAVQQLLYRPRGISPETRDRVAAVYDALHMTPGSSEFSRRYAARAGWAPPLAWDDIDDLQELPATYIVEDLRRIHPEDEDRVDVDEAVVLRVLTGDVLPTSRPERGELVRRWHLNTGLSLAELGRRLGIKPEKYSGGQVAS